MVVGVIPAGIAWGVMYWALGERAAALFPWIYTALSVACLAVYARRGASRSCAIQSLR